MKLYVPKINYIVFELVDVNVGDDVEYEAEMIDTIYLAVMPTQIRYAKQSRDSIMQTYSDVYLTKYDYAPEQVSISGSFGDSRRFMAGDYMNGWERLRQFQEVIVEESKKVEEGKIYAVNYYDFAFQKYGQINISGWDIQGNANLNTNYVQYNCKFIKIGDILKTDKKDLSLELLTKIYGEHGIISSALEEVNNFLALDETKTVLSTLGLAQTFSQTVLAPMQESVLMLNNITDTANYL